MTIDGGPEPSSVAHVDASGQISTGNTAWRLAVTDPDGFVGAPLAEGTGTVQRHGHDIEVADLVAATLRLVADEAARLCGTVPVDVRMCVPAGWGPRRRTWLRQAARRAGLGMPTLVETPIAVANHQLLAGVQLPVGTFVLVCDVGATMEASVLRRGPGGFEVLSTLYDADAGGQAVDKVLADTLLVPATGATNGTPSWAVLASMRTGKEAVSFQPAVTVPLPPPDPAVIVNAATVEAAAQPVLSRAADLAAAAVGAAEISPADLAAVYAVGAVAAMPALRPAVEQRLGVPVQVVPMPGATAVLGAAEATGAAFEETAGEVPPPTLRSTLGLLVPGILSLILFAHFVFSADFSGSRVLRTPPWWVWANWGELAIACVLTLVVCVAASPWIGLALSRDQRLKGRWDAPGQRAAGQITAVAIAAAVAALYAVAGGLYFILPFTLPLRWALLPILPIGLIVVAIALRNRKRPGPPAGDFPMLPVLLMGGGDLLFSYTVTSRHLPWLHLWFLIGTRVGVALIGVGIAMLLLQIAVLRTIAAVTLGVFGFFIADFRLNNVLGVAVSLAVTGWWAQRLWALLR
ncbi:MULTISPECIES: Hsp70 family protein [unclassified Actinoplanes]|uniref:Hsp70 family protein n=1 Tax=unclassified Actinoplanes TaxID=2626549 RepID=UPI0002DCB31C|nr:MULTISPECIES: Hsp70 family protein [unclassified Actinoplanes]